MEIQYKIIDNEAVILSCSGYQGEVNLPAELNGCPVGGIGPYAFSEPSKGLEKGLKIYTANTREEIVPGSRKLDLRGDNISIVHLPKSLKTIGKYAFYNCRNLKGIDLYGGHIEMENGAFMNCDNLSYFNLYSHPEELTCLTPLLTEVQGEVNVYYRFSENIVWVLFPEFYEESIENTPARVFHYLIYGAGYRYRQCLNKGKLKLTDYDNVFLSPEIQTEKKTALKIAQGRLSYPYGLTKQARDNYLSYIRNNDMEAVHNLVEENKGKDLEFLMQFDIFSETTFEEALILAAKLGRADCLRILMEHKRLKYPPREKNFEI